MEIVFSHAFILSPSVDALDVLLLKAIISSRMKAQNHKTITLIVVIGFWKCKLFAYSHLLHAVVMTAARKIRCEQREATDERMLCKR